MTSRHCSAWGGGTIPLRVRTTGVVASASLFALAVLARRVVRLLVERFLVVRAFVFFFFVVVVVLLVFVCSRSITDATASVLVGTESVSRTMSIYRIYRDFIFQKAHEASKTKITIIALIVFVATRI